MDTGYVGRVQLIELGMQHRLTTSFLPVVSASQQLPHLPHKQWRHQQHHHHHSLNQIYVHTISDLFTLLFQQLYFDWRIKKFLLFRLFRLLLFWLNQSATRRRQSSTGNALKMFKYFRILLNNENIDKLLLLTYKF